MTASLPVRPTPVACKISTANPILLHPSLITMFRLVGESGAKRPCAGPTTEINFMDGNRGNICTCAFSYVIGLPGRAVADCENTS